MNPRISPIYLLRSYAWAVVKNNTPLNESDYGGLVPIVPLGEEKELSEYSKPHIVYGYAMSNSGDLWAQRRGSMSFAVYANNFAELTNLLTILTEAFGRQDESAKDVNEFTSIYNYPNYLGIRFGSIELGFVEGGSPEESEGGNMSGILNISFEFYVDYTVKTSIKNFLV